MTKTLKETLKEIQILLGKPQRKIAGSLKYYLNFFNVAETKGRATETAQKKEKMQRIQHNKVTWVDIKNPSRRVISRLAQEYPFHPLHLEDCISKGQFPKIEESDEDKYLFLLLRFPRYQQTFSRDYPEDSIANNGGGKIIINQVCFFLGKDYLVTIHEDTTNTISHIFDECKHNPELREAYMSNSSAHLLYIIIDQLTNNLTPLLQAILKEVDETEDIVFDDKVTGIYKIGHLRQKIVSLRRVIGPLRTLLNAMVSRINRLSPKFSSRNLSVYFDNTLHRVEKAWETLEEARETVEIYKDADFTISTEKTSRILAVLTIIFTLSIPATVIGTFYGMNILLPGGIEAGKWTFWGNYTTFLVILIIAIIPAVLMYWYFRRRGWF